MTGQSQAWPAVRAFHLLGGCRAIVGFDQIINLDPIASNGLRANFKCPTYHGAFGILRQVGFEAIGSTFIFDEAQAKGTRLPDWRAFYSDGASLKTCTELADKWSFIAHGALKEKNGQLWDVASRLGHQSRVCEWRLKQLSECYHAQLAAKIASGDFKEGTRYKDQFTWFSYLAIQSFLVDACVLRDYMAEYYALVLSEGGTQIGGPKITSIGALKKQFLDKTTSSDEVFDCLKEATAPNGWLYELGSYRNLVVHVAPLAMAGKSLYAVCTSMQIDAKASLPAVKLPIPPEPWKIAEDRASGEHFSDPELSYARFSNALKDVEKAVDGLAYAHKSLGRLASLGNLLQKISPVKPEMPTLSENDIIALKVNGVEVKKAPSGS